MKPKFRIPIVCSNCKHRGFDYWKWNGQKFIKAGYDPCDCEKSAYEVVGDPQQCLGQPDENNVVIYAEDRVKVSNFEWQLQLLEIIGRVAERYSSWGITDLKIIKFEKYSPRVKPPGTMGMMYFLNIIDSKKLEVVGNTHQQEK